MRLRHGGPSPDLPPSRRDIIHDSLFCRILLILIVTMVSVYVRRAGTEELL